MNAAFFLLGGSFIFAGLLLVAFVAFERCCYSEVERPLEETVIVPIAAHDTPTWNIDAASETLHIEADGITEEYNIGASFEPPNDDRRISESEQDGLHLVLSTKL